MNNDRDILIKILSPEEALPADDARGVRAGPMADYLLELRYDIQYLKKNSMLDAELIQNLRARIEDLEVVKEGNLSETITAIGQLPLMQGQMERLIETAIEVLK